MNYRETHNSWNKLAEVYEQKFMHLTIYKPSYNFLLEQLKHTQTAVLEVGCGPANISYYLNTKNNNLQFTLSDVAPNMLALAKKNIPEAETILLDTTKINSLNKKFDVLISGFCIPYLAWNDVEQFFLQAYSVLNKNGFFYLSFVDGDYENSSRITGSTGLGVHFYYFDKAEIKTSLQQIGFDFVKEFSFPYQKGDGTMETHIVYIFKHRNIKYT